MILFFKQCSVKYDGVSILFIKENLGSSSDLPLPRDETLGNFFKHDKSVSSSISWRK